MTLHNYAKSDAKSQKNAQYISDGKYGPALKWSKSQILSRGEALGMRDIPYTIHEGGELVHLSWKAYDIENIFSAQPELRNYLKYAQVVVMGIAKSRPDSSTVFDVEIVHYLKGIPYSNDFSVANMAQGHIGLVTDELSHTVSDGQLCVFFPSETYTQYRRAFPLDEAITEAEMDNTLRFESFPRMCEKEDGVFTFTKTGKDEKLLFKDDILKIAPPIVKDEAKPMDLALANSVMAINSWDIFTVNGFRSPRPLASLYIAGPDHVRDLQMICGPNLSGGQIINGKFIGGGLAHDIESLKQCKDRTNGSLGYHFSKNLKTGRFYGDRQTLYFESPDLDFIAKRADRGPRRYGWGPLYAMNSIEKCVLDHPNIGVNNYAGYGFNGKGGKAIYLTAEGTKFWNTCKPDYALTVKEVEHSLLFLIENTLEINLELEVIDPGVPNKAYLDVNANGIGLHVEPQWADKHRLKFEQLKARHPYLIVREEQFDEIILTAQ